MVNIKWIYDLPKIGPYLRRVRYQKAFDLSSGEIAIDCGANVGKVTKRMAQPGVTVYAFEPDPNAFRILKANMKGYENVICLNKAVSDHNGVEKIYFTKRYKEDPGKWSTGTTLLHDKPHVDQENSVSVEVVDFSEFIRKLGKPVALFKLDVEGEEIRVLNKLIDTGEISNIRNILVETHERFPSLKDQTKKLRRRIRELKLKNIDLNWA
ncbi:MAG TPA: FkbM family methyltransferase [Candidatus Paceibacterota bacterium]